MNAFIDSIHPFQNGLSSSGMWLRWVDLICLVGALLGTGMMLLRWSQIAAVREGRAVKANPLEWPSTLALLAAVVVGSVQVWMRYREVNHFPSQTMSEVIVMSSFSLLVSMLILHFALQLKSIGYGWAIMGDALLVLVLLGVIGINCYTLTLSSAERDLPPALQSYWFPPHLAALIFSYATLTIAGLVTVIYFCLRFWMGVFRGGYSKGSQLLLLACLLLIPFAQVATIPIFVLMGAVLFLLKLRGHLPGREFMAPVEGTMEEVSYRAFSVGIPFLTAGLFMGAFWAQEAWANYWGWDSKENSALITWLVYIAYIHLRMLGGYRGEKAMAVLAAGAMSVFITFQVFGFLPDSQKSLHRYTDDGVVPTEGMQGKTSDETQARLEVQR